MIEPDALVAARAAIDRADWGAALDALGAADPDVASSPAGLELRAQAAYGHGDFEESITAWEDLYALHMRGGDRVEAARAAAMSAMFLMIDTGMMAPVRAWLRRAELLLDGAGDVVPTALVVLVRTYERFMSGDIDAARELAARSRKLGERLGVMPAVVIGRVAGARVMLFDGHLDAGLDELDDIATLLVSGDVDPLTTGMMYCELVCAAQGLGLHDKVVEWTDLMDRWRHRAAFGGLSGRCRVHRAEVLRVSGPCDAAEEEALLACEELRPWMRREFGWPLVELGNIRLRKGDLAGAEEAFLQAHERAWCAHPGLALLRLAQGDVAGASELITEAIAHPFDLPWKERPPIGDLRLAPLWEAQAEIAVAAGDLATARSAADALRAIAARFPGAVLRAASRLADARVQLLAGDLSEAKSAAMEATTLWADVGAPFDAAVARVVLAEVRDREGNPEGARVEWHAARSAFAAFGALGWTERCDARLTARAHAGSAGSAGSAASAVPPPADAAPGAVFRQQGNTRLVRLAGRETVLQDLKGLRYVARLLSEPNREFHVLDLVAVEEGALAPEIAHSATRQGARRIDRATGAGGSIPSGSTALPVLDDRAREAYRRRLADVEEDIADAVAMNDPVRQQLAERDRDYLVAELQSALGLGGRHRSTGGTAERARTAVTRSVRYALERLAEHHPTAAAHLQQHVHTGTYCRYVPDPVAPLAWET